MLKLVMGLDVQLLEVPKMVASLDHLHIGVIILHTYTLYSHFFHCYLKRYSVTSALRFNKMFFLVFSVFPIITSQSYGLYFNILIFLSIL